LQQSIHIASPINFFFQLDEAIKNSFKNFFLRFEERCRTDNDQALQKSVDVYKNKMEEADNLFHRMTVSFDWKHNESKNSAIQFFINEPKMGGTEFSTYQSCQFTRVTASGEREIFCSTYLQEVSQ
jgi:hypothetical protein